MHLVYDKGILIACRICGEILNLQRINVHIWNKLSLTDKGEGEELIDTKVGRVHPTDSKLWPSQLYLQCMYDMC